MLTAAQIIVIAAIVVQVVKSIIDLSSPQSCFSLINHLQLVILLPMIKIYYPTSVLFYIEGMDISMMGFDFLGISSTRIHETWVDRMTSQQDDEYLQSIGLNKTSSFVNALNILVIVGVVIILHLIICCVYF